MNKFLLVSALLICIGICRAAPQYPSLADFRFNDLYCGDTHTGRQLYIGEMFTRPGSCIRIQCLGNLQLWEDSCKVPRGLKGTCAVVPQSETNLDYPRCCPLYECKSYMSNAQGKLETTNTYDHNGNLRKSHVTEIIVLTKDRRLDPAGIPTAPVRKYQV